MFDGWFKSLDCMTFTRLLHSSIALRTLSRVSRICLCVVLANATGAKVHIVDIFQPLYEVTKDPGSHPNLHVFLQRCIGFDSVDDESKPERRIYRKYPLAKEWDNNLNPPYSYYLYYMYANLCSLNHWRKLRGFSK